MTEISETTRSRFADFGIDIESAMMRAAVVPISMPCWQFDDVSGLENVGATLRGGGIAATGTYPGKPRTGEELRQDIELALCLCPGITRLNLHACYAERADSSVDRDAYTVADFSRWMEWAAELNTGLDFNPSFFSHPNADKGFTLSSPDEKTRQFWVNHGKACRKIAEAIGEQQGNRCTVNVWIPDGYKDLPADRLGPRQRLTASLDDIFSVAVNENAIEDAVESKLFGIGSEAYVVGSFEFYYGYAQKNQKLLCLDAGHFHPTETITDKISSVLMYLPNLLLHLTRGMRWDSDHVVILDDLTKEIIDEVVRGNYLDRVRIGLDYFDASINRIAAATLGVRSTRKALLMSMLQPHAKLKELEAAGDFTARLCLLEEIKTLPFGEIWEAFCIQHDCPGESEWLKEIQDYEESEFPQRA
ncbi:L-rhamnose isomerase [Kiritimatiellota bacterium B12222]|nr:L-rhamnose isomerase [Kiritimatiellota bacterium B12222]